MNDQTPIQDPYHWWRGALAAPHMIGKSELPVHADVPQCGYYFRRTEKQGPREPAAIWLDTDTGEMLAITGFAGKEQERRADALWTWVAKNPISYEMYAAAFETGRWPDEADDAKEPAPSGDNSRKMTPQEVAEAAVNKALANAALWLKRIGKAAPSTKEEADQGSNLAAAVHNAAAAAVKLHKELKAPVLEEGRGLDAWKNSVCEPAEKTKAELLAKVTAWSRAEQRRLDEERRKAQEAADAAARAERQRQLEEINAIAAAKAMEAAATLHAEEAAGVLAQITEEANKAAQTVTVEVKAAPVPVVKVATGGATGRKTSLRTIKTAVITDFAAALAACADTDEVREAVQAVATKRMRANITMAGVEIKEEQEARL
jgi:hypothetical protein